MKDETKKEVKKGLLRAGISVLAVLAVCLCTGQADIFRRARVEISQYIDSPVYKQGGVEYDLAALGGGSKHVVQDEGTDQTARTNLNFEGSAVTVTDDPGNDATKVTITGGSGAVDSVNGQTGAVSLDTDDIAEGAAKYNVTHTGEITGATTLTLGKTAITNRTSATPATGDGFAFTDVSDSDNLKKATLADILALISGLTDSQISDTLTASKVIGSGSTSDAVDAATGELAGVVPYAKGGTGLSALGTAGQVLRTNGAGTAIEWGTPSTGGDPTYGSDAAASDDALYVDADDKLGIGTTTPIENLDIYSDTDGDAPRIALRYFVPAGGDVTQYPSTWTGTTPGTSPTWANPSYASSDNATNTTCTYIGGGVTDSQTLKGTMSTPFAIPGTATVDGVKVEVEGQMGIADATELHAWLVRGGTIDTSVDRATGANWGGTMTVITYGGALDDWGGITAAEVNDTGFGFAFQGHFADNASIGIDFIRITVYYSTADGDYKWTQGIDLSDGAYTIRADATDWIRVNYTTGLTEFTGIIDADGYKQDGVLYDLSTFGSGAGDVVGPASATDNAIPRFDLGTGKLLQNSTVLIDDSGNVTLATGDTVDGRELSTDGAKLDGIEAGATADQTNAEIEAAYNAQVAMASDAEALAGSSPNLRRWTPGLVARVAYGQEVRDDPTSSTSYTPNGENKNQITLTLAGATTINAPTGTLVDGARLFFRIKQGAGPYSLTWNTVFKTKATWGLSGAIPAISTTANEWNYFEFVYNAGVSEWHLINSPTAGITDLTGEVTAAGPGSVAATLGKTAISNRSSVSPAAGDYVLLGDVSNSDVLIKSPLSNLWALISGLTDSQISDTLTASLFVGSGSSTTAVDLATAEVAGDLPFANITQVAQYEVLGRAASGTGDVKALTRVEQDTAIEVESELTSATNATAWNSTGVRYFHDTLTQNTTVSADSGTLRTNQYVQFRFTAATGSDYTLAWNSLFAAGSGTPFAGTIPAMTTVDGRDSVYLFQYRGTKLWLCAHREDN